MADPKKKKKPSSRKKTANQKGRGVVKSVKKAGAATKQAVKGAFDEAGRPGEKTVKKVTKAAKRKFGRVKKEAPGKIEETREKVRTKTGEAKDKFNENRKTRGTRTRVNRANAVNLDQGRVTGTPIRNKLGKVLKTGLRAGRLFGTGGLALQAGFEGGQAAVQTDTAKGLMERFNIGGAGDLDPFGRTTLSALDRPDQPRPPDDEGGVFSRPVDNLSILDDEQGRLVPRGLNQASPNQPVTVDEQGRVIEDPSAGVGTSGTGGGNAQEKPLSIRDALSGFERSGNVIGDGLALQARLGIASGINRKQERDLAFQEEQRKNDFDQAVDLSKLELDHMKAQGETSKRAQEGQKLRNSAWQAAVANINNNPNLSDQEKSKRGKQISFQSAESSGFNPGSPPTITLYAELQDSIQNADLDFLSRAQFGVGALGDPDAPLFDENTVQDWTIDEGVLYYNGDPVNDMFDIGDEQDQQYLTEVVDFHDNVGRKKPRRGLSAVR